MNDLYPLVDMPASQSQRRGGLLEGTLKRLFQASEISVCDACEVVKKILSQSARVSVVVAAALPPLDGPKPSTDLADQLFQTALLIRAGVMNE